MSNKLIEDIEWQDFSIVCLGNFNPSIFQPLWFSEYDLIRKEEAETAKIDLVHNDGTSFELEWCLIQVLQQRFLAATRDPTMGLALRDLVQNTFTILEHTPVRSLGMNRNCHIRLKSSDFLERLLEVLAPHSKWQTMLSRPHLSSISYSGKNDNSQSTIVNIKLEESNEVHPGIFININQHYSLDDDSSINDNKIAGNLRMRQLLTNEWESFIEFCEDIYSRLLSEETAK